MLNCVLLLPCVLGGSPPAIRRNSDSACEYIRARVRRRSTLQGGGRWVVGGMLVEVLLEGGLEGVLLVC